MNPMMNQMLNRLIQQNPGITQNMQTAQIIKALQTGDPILGQQLAQNLCQTYGVTPEQAMAQAKQYFGFQ